MKTTTPTSSTTRLLKVLQVSLVAALYALPPGSAHAETIAAPASVRASGVLNIATYAGFPPLEYMKDGKFVGAEIELGDAIAERLGVRATFTHVPFEGLIPGLLAGRYDIALSDISDTAPRREQVDFVDYAQVFTSLIVHKGNPHSITSLDQLCGLPVATQLGSMQSRILDQKSEECTAGGKPPIAISRFPSMAQVGLELSSGRSVVQVRDFSLGAYEVKHSEGKLEVVSVNGKPAMLGKPGKVGIALKKGNPEMIQALQAALKSLKADGTYDRILEKWDVGHESISDFSVNDENNG
jgi:polar amino acid transport system substrate-binding protein